MYVWHGPYSVQNVRLLYRKAEMDSEYTGFESSTIIQFMRGNSEWVDGPSVDSLNPAEHVRLVPKYAIALRFMLCRKVTSVCDGIELPMEGRVLCSKVYFVDGVTYDKDGLLTWLEAAKRLPEDSDTNPSRRIQNAIADMEEYGWEWIVRERYGRLEQFDPEKHGLISLPKTTSD